MRALLLFFLSIQILTAAKTEILWDSYGVPHIYAPNREAMFYAHGWAQMRGQADLLLLLYGESRGRAAEYWGPEHLELDRWVQINGVPERAAAWYQAQSPEFQKYLDAFAAGINDFAKAHPEAISPERRVVLPVSGVDVVGHALRVVHYMYIGSRDEMKREVGAHLKPGMQAALDLSYGSNTWTIGPSRTASHNAMLLDVARLFWVCGVADETRSEGWGAGCFCLLCSSLGNARSFALRPGLGRACLCAGSFADFRKLAGHGGKDGWVLGRMGLVFLLAGACTAVSFCTIFGLESRVYRGELVEVHNDGWLNAARVVGLDGDGRVEVDGGFFIVDGRQYSRTPSPVPQQNIAARLIAVWSPVRRSVVVLK